MLHRHRQCITRGGARLTNINLIAINSMKKQKLFARHGKKKKTSLMNFSCTGITRPLNKMTVTIQPALIHQRPPNHTWSQWPNKHKLYLSNVTLLFLAGAFIKRLALYQMGAAHPFLVREITGHFGTLRENSHHLLRVKQCQGCDDSWVV